MLRWLNAEKDTLFVQVDGEIDRVIGPENDDWAELTKQKGIAKFVAPPVDPQAHWAGMQLTRRQVFIGMEKAGLISADEAIAVATVGTVPAAINAAIMSLPKEDQTPAFITFGLFQTAYRADPMVALFQATAGMSDDQMDAFFTTFASI